MRKKLFYGNALAARARTFASTRKGILVCALLVGMLGLSLAGCGSAGEQAEATTESSASAGSAAAAAEEPVSRDIFAMDTYMTLSVYESDTEKAEAALDEAVDEINRIEELVSTGIDTSEIAKLNENGSEKVSETTGYLIERSKEIYESTGGVFDITVYPIMKAWGFPTENYRVPKKTELAKLRKLMGADEIDYDEESGEVTLGKNGMAIDLGGIAKGYTSSRVMDIFKKAGIESAVISLGGNVQTLNAKPDGSKWRVAVEDPEDTSSYVGVLSIEDKAVITSGGYERYFEKDGKTYHHIIDPATGYPADSGLTSVTIVSDDGTLADGLSTSLFIMGAEKAETYWRAHSDEFDTILVQEDGSVLVTEGIADDFESDAAVTVIKK